MKILSDKLGKFKPEWMIHSLKFFWTIKCLTRRMIESANDCHPSPGQTRRRERERWWNLSTAFIQLFFHHHCYLERGWRIRPCMCQQFFPACKHGFTTPPTPRARIYEAKVQNVLYRKPPCEVSACTVAPYVTLRLQSYRSADSPSEKKKPLSLCGGESFRVWPELHEKVASKTRARFWDPATYGKPEWTRTTMKVIHHVKALLFRSWLIESKIGGHLDAAKTVLWSHWLYYSFAALKIQKSDYWRRD